MKIVFSVGALALIVALGVWYTSRTDAPRATNAPTAVVSTEKPAVGAPLPAGKQTYTNETIGITLDYDASLTVSEDMPEQVRFWKWGPTQAGETELYDGVIVTFQKANVDGGLDAYLALRLKELENVGTITKPLTTIDFAGRSARTYSASALGDFTVIAVPLDGKAVLEITAMAPDPKGVGFAEEVNALIASVRFLP